VKANLTFTVEECIVIPSFVLKRNWTKPCVLADVSVCPNLAEAHHQVPTPVCLSCGTDILRAASLQNVARRLEKGITNDKSQRN